MPNPKDGKPPAEWGNITARPSSNGTRWLVRWPLPPDPLTAKRRWGARTFASKDEAETFLILERAEIAKGAAVDPSRATVADLFARWWTEYAAPQQLQPRTLESYRHTIDAHVLPRLGHKRAQALTRADVSLFRASVAKDLGGRSAELAMLRLKQLLSWAAAMELIARDVSAGLTLKAGRRDERRALSHAEALAFLDAAEQDHYHPLWRLLWATGLRRGEALGLRWRDCDLERAILSVRQQVVLQGKPKRPTIRPFPKTAASVRDLPIDPELVQELWEHRERQREEQQQTPYTYRYDLVFCTRYGSPCNPNNVLRNFHAICTSLHIAEANIHSLRHTHASHLILAGVPLLEVSKRLGHSKVSTTVDLYAHLIADHQGQSVAAIARLMQREVPELPG